MPENLTSISIEALARCSDLSINAPSLSTTAFDNSGFKDILVKAGFSRINPKDTMLGQPTKQRISEIHGDIDMYYHWKTWASLKDVDGRLPLFTGAAKSLKWSYLRKVFIANMPIINEIDLLTGLPLFMLAAAGPTSNIESVYRLLKEDPTAINIMDNKHQSSSPDNRRKRIREFSQDRIAKAPKV